MIACVAIGGLISVPSKATFVDSSESKAMVGM
jgi:hypothetical protein